MQPAFHQKQLLNLYAVMLDCIQSLLREWEAKPDGIVIDLADGNDAAYAENCQSGFV